MLNDTPPDRPRKMSEARLITFEGIDGAGKSTHIDTVANYFAKRGSEVVRTREPGGTPLAERLREILLHTAMDAQTEALLAFAARRDHVQKVIVPALDRGCTVLCDRFTDATFAYQGGGGGVSVDFLNALEFSVLEGLRPDLTFWFDLSPLMAAQRRALARKADRFEQKDLDFFERVRAVYQTRCDEDTRRFVRLDAAQDRDAVAAQIRAALTALAW
jgi:dTMP kinase